MNLRNFYDCIDKVVVYRGINYYQSGEVWQIQEKKTGIYEAKVTGTYLYTVDVELKENYEVVAINCTCPYDQGPYCKHELAVLCVLEEMLIPKDEQKNQYEMFLNNYFTGSEEGYFYAEPDDYEQLTQILRKSSQEELIDLIISLAKARTDVAERIVRELEKEDMENLASVEDCRMLIRYYTQSCLDIYDYLDDEALEQALEGVKIVLKKADKAFEQGNNLRALEIYLCVLVEEVDFLKEQPEFPCYYEGYVEEILSKIARCTEETEDLQEEEKIQMFEFLLENTTRKWWFDDRSISLSLINTALAVAFLDSHKERLIQALKPFLNEEPKDSVWRGNAQEKAAIIMYRILEKFGGQEVATEYLYKHLEDYDTFCDIVFFKLLKEQQFSQAEAIARIGEKSSYYGVSRKWKENRLKCYEQAGEVEKARGLLFEFASEGDFDYFQRLKKTYTLEAWQEDKKHVVEAIKEKASLEREYPQILVYEGEKSFLLELVKKSKKPIEYYYRYLIPEYQEEIKSILFQQIQDSAQSASNRAMYQQVCQKILFLYSLGGAKMAKELVEEFREEYKKKPAFLDELSKISF